MPEETITYTALRASRAAPRVTSASAPRLASLSRWTGRSPNRRLISAATASPSQPGRIAVGRTAPRSWSIGPDRAIPTPMTSDAPSPVSVRRSSTSAAAASSAPSASWSTSSGRIASASTVRERSETAAWMRSWPKSMPTTAPAERSSESRVGGRPVAMLAGASGSECSTISPWAWRSATRLDTVERDSPVTRAISARLAVPRSRRVSTTRRRLSSRNDSSDPVLTPVATLSPPRAFVKTLHELSRKHGSECSGRGGRQLLLELHDRREQVAALAHPRQHLVGGEGERLGIARLEDALDLVPVERRGHRRPLAGAQRVDGHRRLVLVVLAPVDEHLAAAQRLPHVGDDERRVAALEDLGERVRERLGHGVGG